MKRSQMKRSQKQIYILTQDSSGQQALGEDIIAKRTLLQSATLSIGYIFGVLLCLSIPSFSMEPEEEERLWLKMSAQKSVAEIYRSRWEKGSPLTEEEKAFLLRRCALEGHSFAQLEVAETIFFPYLGSGGSFKIESLQQDCHSTSSREIKVSEHEEVASPGTPTITELNIAKNFAELALKGILNITDGNDDVSKVWGGLTGFRPYQPFADKTVLTDAETKELFLYWNTQYIESQKLSKYDEESGETLTFNDRYPTTRFWTQYLYRNTKDVAYFLLVHQLLNKLDALPETGFSDELPWWRDSGWVKKS